MYFSFRTPTSLYMWTREKNSSCYNIWCPVITTIWRPLFLRLSAKFVRQITVDIAERGKKSRIQAIIMFAFLDSSSFLSMVFLFTARFNLGVFFLFRCLSVTGVLARFTRPPERGKKKQYSSMLFYFIHPICGKSLLKKRGFSLTRAAFLAIPSTMTAALGFSELPWSDQEENTKSQSRNYN